MIVDSSMEHLFGVMEYLVDDRTGVIRRVGEARRESGAPDLFYFFASACETGALSRQKSCGIPGGGGASADRKTAMAKAIGEAVERYCGTIYEAREFPVASFESAPFPCVPPGEFALYSPEQYAQADFPYVPFKESTAVRWTPALNLMTGETCCVPTAMVFLSYVYDRPSGEEPIFQSMSTGLACHVDPVQAAASAMCEVIERDAFTVTWQARLARPRVRIESLSDGNRDLVERFSRTGSAVTVLDLTMDHGIPTVLSVLRSQSPEAPALVFGASASLDPERAIRKSLEELAHVSTLAQVIKREMPRLKPGPNYENVVSLYDHANVYCDHRNARLASFLFESKKQKDFHEIEKLATGESRRDLEILCNRVRAVGHRAFLIDVTSDDVRGLGLSVMRAVIPGFHPLFFGYKIRALGGKRLWEVPQKLGYPGLPRVGGDNPAPHPFA